MSDEIDGYGGFEEEEETVGEIEEEQDGDE